MKVDRLVESMGHEVDLADRRVASLLQDLATDPHRTLRCRGGDRNLGAFAQSRAAKLLAAEVDALRKKGIITAAKVDAFLEKQLALVTAEANRVYPGKQRVAQILDDETVEFYQRIVDRFKGIQELTDLEGDTILRVTGLRKESSEVLFFFETGVLKMAHPRVCCSDGQLEDFEGDEEDFIGHPLIKIEVSSKRDETRSEPPDSPDSTEYDWTFYKLRSDKGYLDLRWLGNTGQTGMYSSAIECHWFPAETAQLVVDIWRSTPQIRKEVEAAILPFQGATLKVHAGYYQETLSITFPAPLYREVQEALQGVQGCQWGYLRAVGEGKLLPSS